MERVCAFHEWSEESGDECGLTEFAICSKPTFSSHHLFAWSSDILLRRSQPRPARAPTSHRLMSREMAGGQPASNAAPSPLFRPGPRGRRHLAAEGGPATFEASSYPSVGATRRWRCGRPAKDLT